MARRSLLPRSGKYLLPAAEVGNVASLFTCGLWRRKEKGEVLW